MFIVQRMTSNKVKSVHGRVSYTFEKIARTEKSFLIEFHAIHSANWKRAKILQALHESKRKNDLCMLITQEYVKEDFDVLQLIVPNLLLPLTLQRCTFDQQIRYTFTARSEFYEFDLSSDHGLPVSHMD